MEKFIKILNTTMGRAISTSLVIALVLSGFFCFDFYERQINKVKSYYWIYKGDKAYKNHELQNAINCYEYGISLHPKHYKAMYNLANIYVAYEDYYLALKNYERALKIKPEYDVARIDYAIILSRTYETDKAIEEYKKVIETKPRFIRIPFLVDNKKSYTHNRGVAYYNMGLAYRTKSLMAGLNDSARYRYLNKAGESYDKAVEILKSYNSNYNLGLIHQLLQDENQSGYYYCRAIELAPMDWEAHFNYAVLLNDMEQYAGSAEEFKKAGLLLGIKGENEKTKYIFDILNNVHQKIAIHATSDYYEKLKKSQDEALKNSKYKAGKLVLDNEEDDDEQKEYFQNCENKEIFLGDK